VFLEKPRRGFFPVGPPTSGPRPGVPGAAGQLRYGPLQLTPLLFFVNDFRVFGLIWAVVPPVPSFTRSPYAMRYTPSAKPGRLIFLSGFPQRLYVTFPHTISMAGVPPKADGIYHARTPHPPGRQCCRIRRRFPRRLFLGLCTLLSIGLFCVKSRNFPVSLYDRLINSLRSVLSSRCLSFLCCLSFLFVSPEFWQPSFPPSCRAVRPCRRCVFNPAN